MLVLPAPRRGLLGRAARRPRARGRDTPAGLDRRASQRTRWLATRVGLTGLAAVVGVGALTRAVVTWWFGPIDDALNAGARGGNGFLEQTRMQPPDLRRPRASCRSATPRSPSRSAWPPGTVARRTVPAMAITLLLFVVVQVAAPNVRAAAGATERTAAITPENMRGIGISGMGPTGVPTGPVTHLTIRDRLTRRVGDRQRARSTARAMSPTPCRTGSSGACPRASSARPASSPTPAASTGSRAWAPSSTWSSCRRAATGRCRPTS